METKVSYTLVGLFVVVLSTILVIGFIWLSVGVSTTGFENYTVYMHESVSGLSIKSPVKFNGVEVGNVSEIELVNGEPNTVKLTLKITETTPISIDTRAQLDSQGLTGISYVELKGGKPGSPPLKLEKGEEYPVIKSIPSFLFRLDSALTHLSTNLGAISKGLSNLLSRENTTLLTNVLLNVEAITDKISENADKLEDVIEDAQTTLQNTAIASEQLPELLDNINLASQNFDEMAKSISDTSLEVGKTFVHTKTAVETINGELIPNVSTVLENIKSILNDIKGTAQQLEQNPSVLLRGSAPLPPGPGE